jgi:hypothetical protein
MRVKRIKLYNANDTAIISKYNDYYRLYSDKEYFFNELNAALSFAFTQGFNLSFNSFIVERA